MGRWGDGIYDSDDALDYFMTFQDMLARELFYLLSPQIVLHQSDWIAEVLSSIEVMLLFEQNSIGNGVIFEHVDIVQQWRDIFMKVWDGEWEETNNYHAFGQMEYRKQHRSQIIEMFTYLQNIADFWFEIGNDRRPEDDPIPSDYQIPILSVATERGYSYPTRFIRKLIHNLQKDIVYFIFYGKRSYSEEEIVVAVDVLGFLCEKYNKSPDFNSASLSELRDKTIQIWRGRNTDYEPNLNNINITFDRLEAVARKYPAYKW
jgi:hypothetical protein